MSGLRFSVGDRVRIVSAASMPALIGSVFTVAYVGPWLPGERQPNGLTAGWGCDYLLDACGDHLACREANLEAA